MAPNAYERKAFLKKVALTESELAYCEHLGLIHGERTSAQAAPVYQEEQVRDAQQIARLLRMGYSYPEIIKIVKKIGLPKQADVAAASSKEEMLTVGQLAERVQVNSRTIKYWEERGIIAPDGRTVGGFRMYAGYYVPICRLIVDLQNFGYTLEQIKERADLARLFYDLQADREKKLDRESALAGLDAMEQAMQEQSRRTKELREGMARWEKLLKTKRKELKHLRNRYGQTKQKS